MARAKHSFKMAMDAQAKSNEGRSNADALFHNLATILRGSLTYFSSIGIQVLEQETETSVKGASCGLSEGLKHGLGEGLTGTLEGATAGLDTGIRNAGVNVEKKCVPLTNK